MDKAEIGKLLVGDTYLGFSIVRSSKQCIGKTGSGYLDMTIADKTGEINCKMWNGTVPPPPVGSIIKIRGMVQEFNGRQQLRIDQMRAARDDDQVPLENLIPCAPEKPAAMRQRIEEVIFSFASADLQKLVREMLLQAGDALDWYPAAQRMHHAERSGLLHHTTSMLQLAEKVCSCYPYLHRDLLMAGVIIHDLSKIAEMESDTNGNVKDYSRDGKLVGHLVRGVVMVDRAAAAAGVSGELVNLLEHLVCSHHGIPEYGSPRMPMIPEAEALHWIDTLDARMNEMQGIQDRTPAGAFSEKIFSLDNRQMYHPFYTDDAQ